VAVWISEPPDHLLHLILEGELLLLEGDFLDLL
jgi:hypothetical protein